MHAFHLKAAALAAALAGALLASGCASSHDVVALTGTIVSVRDAAAANAYHVYQIRRPDDSLIEVPAFASVAAGTCVDVLVSSLKAKSQPGWAPTDITLRQTNTCAAGQELAQNSAHSPSH